MCIAEKSEALFTLQSSCHGFQLERPVMKELPSSSQIFSSKHLAAFHARDGPAVCPVIDLLELLLLLMLIHLVVHRSYDVLDELQSL